MYLTIGPVFDLVFEGMDLALTIADEIGEAVDSTGIGDKISEAGRSARELVEGLVDLKEEAQKAAEDADEAASDLKMAEELRSYNITPEQYDSVKKLWGCCP